MKKYELNIEPGNNEGSILRYYAALMCTTKDEKQKQAACQKALNMLNEKTRDENLDNVTRTRIFCLYTSLKLLCYSRGFFSRTKAYYRVLNYLFDIYGYLPTISFGIRKKK